MYALPAFCAKIQAANYTNRIMKLDADVLITGVTGFVGRFVLLHLLETQPDAKIAVVSQVKKLFFNASTPNFTA